MKKPSLLLLGILFPCMFFFSCETQEFTEKGLLVPPTVTEDPSLPSIFVNGTQLHSETFGNPSDPMVVAIHGGPGGDYRSILNFKDLADNSLFVVFYDQRGSGLSQRHDEEFYEDKKIQLFIDDLSAVIEYYRNDDNQKVILAGHSWGAMLATAYINQNPEKVHGAILAEPGGLTWPQTEDYIERSFDINPFSERTNDAVYQDQFITGDDHETLDYLFSLWAVNESTGDIAPTPFWRSGAVLSNFAHPYASDHPEEMDFTTNLHEYTTSVLFAYSENNEHYGRTHAELVSSAYPNVQLEQIDDCGHEIIYFGWEDFYPIIVDYVKNVL